MPAQQRLRRNEERVPGATRQHPAEHRQHQPIGVRELRPPRLPPQDRQLLAQHEDLELHRVVTTREQQHQREQPANDDVDERHEHRPPPKTGPPTLPRSHRSTSSTAARLTIEFVHPTRWSRCLGRLPLREAPPGVLGGRGPSTPLLPALIHLGGGKYRLPSGRCFERKGCRRWSTGRWAGPV